MSDATAVTVAGIAGADETARLGEVAEIARRIASCCPHRRTVAVEQPVILRNPPSLFDPLSVSEGAVNY